jgi:hypothetical protein
MMKTEKVSWTRTHLLIALNLYCKISYGKFHNRNPVIADVAARMGRTTNSLAMKLSNFASLDPVHRARGVKDLRVLHSGIGSSGMSFARIRNCLCRRVSNYYMIFIRRIRRKK